MGSRGIPIKSLCSRIPGRRVWKIASLRCVILSITITGCFLTTSIVSVKSANGPSSTCSEVIRPSRMISLSAGTSKSLPLHLTSGVGSRTFATESSYTSGGGDMEAASITAAQFPMQKAISSSSPRESAFS
ncbi:Uncharacterised protein [uncultured archaeon]|nr:Uncharacterised protein [uncultured archaeon]